MHSSVSLTRSFPQRVGIFVDVQNMFYSAKLLHQSKLDYGKILKELVGTRHLVRAMAFIVQKPDVNQAGFHEALSRMGYELRVKELKMRQDPGAREGSTAKGSWEVGMTVEALRLAPKVDVVVLLTGDGDYLPLVEALKSEGCRVELVSFERSTSGDLIKAVDQYIPISEDWIFKEKKFEQSPTPDQGEPPVESSDEAGDDESQPEVPGQPAIQEPASPPPASPPPAPKKKGAFGIFS